MKVNFDSQAKLGFFSKENCVRGGNGNFGCIIKHCSDGLT